MPFPRTLLAASLLSLVLAGCPGGGGHPGAQSGRPPTLPQAPPSGFNWHGTPPHGTPLPNLAWDEASPHQNGGYWDGAGVLVFAEEGGQLWVLMARRAAWLGEAGTWGTFGGTVEKTDLDDTGRPSFSRAAEHELYEESVTVYHRTDARDLRNSSTHLHTSRAGAMFRTFCSRQDYVPAKVFNDGVAYVKANGKPRVFAENDRFLWVPMAEFKACVAAGTRTRTWTFTDPAGAQHTLNLFGGFTRIFTGTFLHVLNGLH